MKKLNQQGFTHHLLILGIAVVVVAAIGFTGWKVYQKNNGSSAKADTWRQVKYYGYGGSVTKSTAYVYSRFNAPKYGTYRVCANVRAATSAGATVMVGGTAYDASRVWIGTTTRTLCSGIDTMNSGQNIIPVVYSFDNNAIVSSATIQSYGL